MTRSRCVLVLAPHTDDGELGCGGSIAKHVRAGDDVHYVAFSSCAESLPAGLPADTLIGEAMAATAHLGIASKEVEILDFPVRKFPAKRQEILEAMIQVRSRINPDIVYLPSSHDIHQDHQVIAAEGLRAFKRSTVLGYELPWNNSSFDARSFVVLETVDLEAKVAALNEYRSQSRRSYISESFTRALARVRGEMAGVETAEAFEVMRLYFR